MLARNLRQFCRLSGRTPTFHGNARFGSVCLRNFVKQESSDHGIVDLHSVNTVPMDREVRFHSTTTCYFTQKENKNSDDPVPISQRIEKLVKNNKVVIFMKGVPDEPMCGFSNAVVQVLRMHGVEGYEAHNVLEDDELRQGIKEYSEWPTVPQVYFDGEFIGGCDILLQMHQSGELIEELEKLGIKSALQK